MMKTMRSLWRLSWIVTLPITVVFLLWASRTHHRYSEFGLRQTTLDNLSLYKSGKLEFDHMAASLRVETDALGVADRLAQTGLRTISLFVREGNLQRLNANLPSSGQEYVKGAMASAGDAVQEVDLRYRGDSVYHWGYWKKSWRVKTDKSELFLGMRKFNLIAPRTANVLNNHLAYLLAGHLGLIGPYSEVVNVVLNGELLGVYILTEQLDESTIRRHSRMPGDLYSGDIAGLERFRGHSQWIFDQPGPWKKVAINNHFEESARAPLEEFLFYLRDPYRPEGQRGLSRMLDVDAMGRSAAFDVLTQTTHSDNSHNWRFYYDPWKTHLVPVIWDPMGWMQAPMEGPPEGVFNDILMSDLHVALLQNPDFLRARHRALEDFFRGGAHKLFLEEARDLTERMELALEAEPNHVFRAELLPRQVVVDRTQAMVDYIKHVFDTIREVHLEDARSFEQFQRLDGGAIRLGLDGRIPLTELELVFDRPIQGPVAANIKCKGGNGNEDVDVSGAASIHGSSVKLACSLLAPVKLSGTVPGRRAKLHTQQGTYDIHVVTRTPEARLLAVRARRGAEGPMTSVAEVKRLKRSSVAPMMHLVEPEPVREPVVFSGDVVIEGNRVIEDDLVIRAGTRLLFEPGANLLAKGRVLAEGTQDAKIEFRPRVDGQEPWGVFAIKGSGADGSQFTHCHFEEGSGWKQPLAEYSAMFSIHHVQRVVVEKCTFEDSRVVDDMVHGVYSEVTFRDCRFVRSLFDALDMDISDVVVQRCDFIDSGNDSVDLMTARAIVDETKFVRSADKGVSVGEDSLVAITNTFFDRCLIGVQTKDESTATIANCDFRGCERAVDGLKKNWRYNGGGEAFIYKSHISGSTGSLGADSSSRLIVRDCYVEDIDAIRRKRVDMDESVDDSSERKAAERHFVRHPEDIEAMGDHGAPSLGSTSGSRRGLRPKRKKAAAK